MERISRDHIHMKPRWYFAIGSLFMLMGISATVIAAVFLMSLTFFLLRQHGPMGQVRLEQMIAGFPWWVPVAAGTGILMGVVILRRYDFSYKHNFRIIVVGFVLSVILAAFAIDTFGLADLWFRRGPMNRFYRQLESGSSGGAFQRRTGPDIRYPSAPSFRP